MTVLAQEIMKKVRRIYILRKLLLPLLFSTFTGLIVISTVSVSHVIQNMPTVIQISDFVRFFVVAFAHTDVVVKSALVAGSLSLLYTGRGVIQGFRLSANVLKI